MEKFYFYQQNRFRVKAFERLKTFQWTLPIISATLIAYSCAYNITSNPVIKGAWVESLGQTKKRYKKHQREMGENL